MMPKTKYICPECRKRTVLAHQQTVDGMNSLTQYRCKYCGHEQWERPEVPG